MGQGYSLTTLSAGSAGIDVPELADLVYEKSLGNARFMKSIRARHKDGLVVAKVVMKPYSSMKLDEYVQLLLVERQKLTQVPNALAYHRIIETSTNGYLVRQYVYSSLYDRMSTRPFLEDIEKKWIAFQLLTAVRDCHARNVYHGDIKTENVLVTSWLWLYLSDFSSSFKPTYLPEDNPADFSFYFDTSGRRTCYLAPERFLTAGSDPESPNGINWAMDIFSVGCVIAELFLEAPIFSLSQLFKYRQGEYDPQHTHLSNISDPEIREMVTHMIQLDPESRYSAEEYLAFWRRKAFPDYFYGFLHQYMYSITDPSSGQKPVKAGPQNLGESDDRIDKIYNDFDKISYFLGHSPGHEQNGMMDQHSSPDPSGGMFPLHIDIPNYRHQASASMGVSVDGGTLIFLNVIVSSLRSTARASARIQACEVLLAFAERVTDEAKLDRIIPFLMALLNDKTDLVQVAALRTLTQLLALVSVVSPINAYIFPEYILPRLQPFIPGTPTQPSVLLRTTYASCIASLATSASRFLDMTQALRADGSLPSNDPEAEDDIVTGSAYQNLFDVVRDELHAQFKVHTTALLTDPESSVRRAMLGSVSSLCVFFGSTKANDVILSHLNTYLNDKDWILKCSFFETIVGVATFVGSASLEEFILPLMVQALTDPEEFVVERALRAFSSMAELGLFQRSKTWELVDVVGRFTMHPNSWIREAAAHFLSSATTYLSIADTHSVIIPLIKPYLKILPSSLSELRLLDSLKKPLPRLVLEMASNWATKVDRGLFWVPAQQLRTFSFGSTPDSIPTVSARELGPKALSRVQKNEEDEQWLTRLRNAGMTPDDEFKLLALREYIWRVAHRKSKDGSGASFSRFNTVIALKDLDIKPQLVLFEQTSKLFDESLLPGGTVLSPNEHGPRTIADALRDASSNLNEISPVAGQNVIPGATRSPLPQRSSSMSPVSDASLRRASLQVPRTKVGGNPSEVSSLDSAEGTKNADHGLAIRHRASAISLLNRADLSNKANPELGTTSTNAFGKIEAVAHRDMLSPTAQPSLLAVAQEQHRISPAEIRYQAAHSYEGRDPSVLKLLDSLYLENYPSDNVEFGFVAPINKRQPLKRGAGHPIPLPWRPEGTLVAMMGEHTAAINRVVVAPDHSFFITGSDDGSVKVWDTARLERNVTNRSRLTHRHADGVKVLGLTFVENTHCFVSTGSEGSIHVVKVDFTSTQSGSTRYGKLKILREHQLPQGEYALWCEHFKSDSQSVLILATNTSRILAIDLRIMTEIWELKNPLHHGTPTCFAIDRRRHWLLLGTTHGVLDLWDLRFRLRLKAWGLPGASPIHRIALQPVRGSRKSKVYVAGGTGQGEVTVWDLEKVVCKEVYRTGLSKDISKSLSLIDIDEERAGGMLGRFATSLEPSGGENSIDRGVRALALGTHVAEDGNEPKQYFLITAGPDWKVRYWDTTRSEVAMVVSGLALEEPQPTYQVSHAGQDTLVVTERLAQTPSQQLPGGASPRGGGSKLSSDSSSKRGSTTKTSRTSIISMQQQHLLKSHLDNIIDVALLEYPYGMIISVDRSGVIYVFS